MPTNPFATAFVAPDGDPFTPDAALDDAALIDELLYASQLHKVTKKGGLSSPRSRASAASTLRTFAAYLAGRDATLWTATAADCRHWLEVVRAERDTAGYVSPATRVKNFSQLRTFYATAVVDQRSPIYGQRSPMLAVAMPPPPPRAQTHAATAAEFDALVATLDLRTAVGLRDAVLFGLMFHSGLRVGETVRVDLDHLGADHATVFVAESKTGESREVAIDPHGTGRYLGTYLRRFRGDHPGPLLWNVGGRRTSVRLTVTAAQNIVKRAARRAGVAVSPHALRRGWATEYVRHGGSGDALMHQAGWTDTRMPGTYFADQRSAIALTDAAAVAERRAARSVMPSRRPLRAVR